MSREIKFRLHDKYGNIIGYEIHKHNEFKTWQIYQISLRGDFIHNNEESLVREGYFIAATSKVQFTGLKDKNGIEIYEGDIVITEFGEKVVVEFGKYLVMEDDWGISHFSTGWHGEFDDKSGSASINEYFEVIGNIYSNPELLNF